MDVVRHGIFNNRCFTVVKILTDHRSEVLCLGLTKGGQPKHPLYLSASTERQRFATSFKR